MSSAAVNPALGDKSQSAFSAVVRKSFSSFSVDSILGGSASAESVLTSKTDGNTQIDEDFRRDAEDYTEEHYRDSHETEGEETEGVNGTGETDGGGGGGGGGREFIVHSSTPKFLSMHAESAFRIATSAAQAYNLIQERLNNRSPPKAVSMATDRPSSPTSPTCEDEEDEDIHVDGEEQDEKERCESQQPQTILRPTALGPLHEPRFPGVPPHGLLGHIPQPGLWPSIPFLHQQLSLRSLNSKYNENIRYSYMCNME